MDQRDQTNQADAQGQQDTVDLPSINAKRTPPYQNPLVNEVSRGAYGATEAEVNRDDDVIAPTFSDTEPGAGTNYGAAGDPDAPNLGGIEDETTLGPNPVRPPERRLVREGEFETASAPDDAAAQSSKSRDEPAQGAASVTNPATDRITQESRPGFMPNGKLTYGNPQVYGDDQIGRFGTSSGSAGELPGGRMIDLAHGGQPEDAWRADPDFPEQAATTLDAAEALNADEPLPNTRQSTSTNPLDQATPSS